MARFNDILVRAIANIKTCFPKVYNKQLYAILDCELLLMYTIGIKDLQSSLKASFHCQMIFM